MGDIGSAEERDEFAPPDAVAPEFVARWSRGRDARARAPRSHQGPWRPGADRPDPVALLEGQATTRDLDIGTTRDFYVRQLHDWKGGIDPETMTPRGAALYARICGETLARGHARSGDRVEVAGYLGRGRAFEEAVCVFADTYADQNERDFTSFRDALSAGRLPTRGSAPSKESP